jgi:hypothetical protein
MLTYVSTTYNRGNALAEVVPILSTVSSNQPNLFPAGVSLLWKTERFW